jgi:hypothetical protein
MIDKENEYLKLVKEAMDANLQGSASAERLLKDWSKNKEHFFTKFGNQTIISTEEISLDVTDESAVVNDFYKFMNKISDYCDSLFQAECIKNFLQFAVRRKGFKDNIVNSDWDSKYVESFYDVNLNCKPIYSINKGTKFSKALRNFFDLKGEDKDEQEMRLKGLQDLYSTFRQKFSSKSKGKLFLSIHPLDYITISDNNHNWSSCHNFYNGDYRIGNLNYMADKTTLVAYFCTDDKFDEDLCILPNTKWNSKRWRVLVHLQEIDGKLVIIYNRQYPFESDVLIKELDKLLLEIYKTSAPSAFMEYGDSRLDNKRLYRTGEGTCHYVDIRKYNNCFVRIANEYLEDEALIHTMTIGEPVYCVKCGENITYRGDSGYCDFCTDEWYCENCEGTYSRDDMIYIESEDRYICYDCYEHYYTECPECGDLCESSNMQYVELLGKDLCINCLEKIQSLEGTLIFSFCNMANQLFEAPDKEESIKSMYSDIREEEEQTIKHYRDKNREVWVISMVKDLAIEDLNQMVYSEMQNLLLAQKEHTNRNANRVLRIDSRWDSPFKRLEYLSNEIPMIREIILLGVIDQVKLDEYLTELNISLEALGIKEEVKLDYSKVRVI